MTNKNNICPLLSMRNVLPIKCKEKQCINWNQNKNSCSYSKDVLSHITDIIYVISKLDNLEKILKG